MTGQRARGPAGQPRRRAARRPGGARRRRGAPPADAAVRPGRARGRRSCSRRRRDVVVGERRGSINPPPPVEPPTIDDLVERLAARGLRRGRGADLVPPVAAAHRPAAAAGRGPRIAAVSEDYPGSLLDVRLPVPDDAARGAGPAGAADRARPGSPARRRRRPARACAARCPRRCCCRPARAPLVVVHPGASVPARRWPAPPAAAVERLVAAGWRVAVTGGPDERPLTAVAMAAARRTGSRPRRPARLRAAGRRARRAAVPWSSATPAPRISPPRSARRSCRCSRRWCRRSAGGRTGVPHVLLGDQDAPCAGQPGPGLPGAGPPLPDAGSARAEVARRRAARWRPRRRRRGGPA